MTKVQETAEQLLNDAIYFCAIVRNSEFATEIEWGDKSIEDAYNKLLLAHEKYIHALAE